MPWFLHDGLATDILGDGIAPIPFRSDGTKLADEMNRRLLARSLWQHLRNCKLPSGRAAIASGRIKAGELVWFNETFWFKDVAKSYRAKDPTGAQLHLKIQIGRTVTIRGRFDAARVTSNSSLANLSGQFQVFVAAFVREVSTDEVQIRPVVIADRGLETAGGPSRIRDDLHVLPRQVDAFKGVDFGQTLGRIDLDVLKHISEDEVEDAFLEIIGEPEKQNDWGGEQCDVWTDRLTVGGEQYQTAMALKGPAKFHPMTVADLGKNGDQIARLADTAADLLVVQHCHSIKAEVLDMLRAYALQPGFVRRYMVIDGYDTVRILRHFDKI